MQLCYSLSGPLTVNVAGWLNDKFYAQGRKDAPLLIMIAGVCLMVPTGIIAPLLPSPVLAMVVLAFNTMGIAMTSATGVTGLMNITPGEIRGQTVALYYMIISLSGLMLGPGTVGWLSDNVFRQREPELCGSGGSGAFRHPRTPFDWIRTTFVSR